jgi:hypothetical protein
MTHTVDAAGREHELTLTEERHAIERQFPGWEVRMKDGHPQATRGDATLAAPAIGVMGHMIADYEHREEARIRREAAGAVARGVALMDERDPGWLEHIDLNRLNLRSNCNCIVGQRSGGNYSIGLRVLGLGLDGEPASRYGFDTGVLASGLYRLAYDALENEWRKVITERRSAA